MSVSWENFIPSVLGRTSRCWPASLDNFLNVLYTATGQNSKTVIYGLPTIQSR
jgi:hypothetical protein